MNLPERIMVWNVHHELPHMGTWATTRYPDTSAGYVSETLYDDVVRERDTLRAELALADGGMTQKHVDALAPEADLHHGEIPDTDAQRAVVAAHNAARPAGLIDLDTRVGKDTGAVRLCVNCGRQVPLSHDRRLPAPECSSPDACTFDMTQEEATDYWRKLYHDKRKKADALRAVFEYIMDGYGLDGPDYARDPDDEDKDDWIVIAVRKALAAPV